MTEATTPTEVTTTIDTTGAQTDPILGAVPGAKEDVTTSLYRAAIGPMCADFYLPIFSRFEATGKPGLSWNSAASLLTLNWLLFRQLWTAALAYVGILAAVGLLVFGIGRLVFQMSDEVSLVLLLIFGLAAFIAPGLLGNMLLHKQCRARMEQALADNPTVTEATSQLQRQASSRLRLLWLALGNVGALGLAALVYMQMSALTAMPQGAADARQTVSGLTTDGSSALAGASASAALAPASAPAMPAASAPAAAASEPASAASAAPVAIASSTPSVPSAPEQSQSKAPAAEVAAATAAPTAAPSSSTPVASAKAAKSQKEAAPTAPKVTAIAAAASATPAASASASKATAEAPPQALFYINVGLFSKPENASRVHAQLLEAGMPSVMKELKTTKARQIRVRVGPYATEEKAEAAAQKIKAMQFEAGIIQK